jgi:hypothetical protein
VAEHLKSRQISSHTSVRRPVGVMVGWRYDGTQSKRLRLVSELPMVALRPATRREVAELESREICAASPRALRPRHVRGVRRRDQSAPVWAAWSAARAIASAPRSSIEVAAGL